ncbi:MAG: hypothetical protein KatS3mg109_0962 [Pirellulaceae bacterium]|nr:MAG: hypothetical protein KatS3mg109_0962 [Pirellulaceae bacterium]GIW94504.1 MAG: hypothetical protein KatS3mg110_2545 [Pirellulaceae bacterium]
MYAMSRRRFLISTSLWVSTGLFVGAHPTPGQVSSGTATLKDQLEKGLKARFPQEFAFINTVVTMVDNGQLPRDIVMSTFLWVRKNRSNKKYLVPYFERILRARAQEVGITIP